MSEPFHTEARSLYNDSLNVWALRLVNVPPRCDRKILARAFDSCRYVQLWLSTWKVHRQWHPMKWIKHGVLLYIIKLYNMRDSFALWLLWISLRWASLRTRMYMHTHTYTCARSLLRAPEGLGGYVRSSGGERWGFLTHRSRSSLSPRGSAMSSVWVIKSVCVCVILNSETKLLRDVFQSLF